MAIGFALRNLRSRNIRSIVAENGVRSIRSSEEAPVGFFQRIVNWVGQLFSGLLKYGGWLTDTLRSVVSFSFTGAWGLIVQTVSNIYNFNWQVTDEDLDQRIDQLRNAVIGQYGSALGQTTGWLACGVAPALGIMTFNELLGAYLLKEVGEEAVDELSSQLVGLIRASFNLEAQKVMTSAFKNTRKAVKKWNKGLEENSWERKVLDSVFGGRSEDLLKTWGDKDRKPWSFRIWVEDKIESIESEPLKTFVEQFYEEFVESCVEAGYVIAQGLDSYVLQQQMTADATNGNERIVQVIPDREADDNSSPTSNERLTLAGSERDIRSQLPQVMTNYQMVENRDVGQWIGTPVAENIRNSPNELTLRIQLFSNKTPPVRDALQRASVTLPDVKPSSLDFFKIKDAVGGNNGYTYGRFMAKARLDNGKSIVCYANTSQNAENRIKELAELIEPDILGITVTEEIKTGARANGQPLQKQPIRIYPYSIYVENKQKILNQSTNPQGLPSLEGTYRRKSNRVEIWPNEKPNDFDLIIQELLRTQGI